MPRQSLYAFDQSPKVQYVQIEIEPKPLIVRAGQVITRNNQRLIDLAIDSWKMLST